MPNSLMDFFGGNNGQQPGYGGGGFGGMSNSLIGLGMGLLTPYNAFKGESPWSNALQGYQTGAVVDQRRQQQQQELALQRERMAQAKALADREPESIRQLRAAGVPQEKWADYLYPKAQPDLKPTGSVTYREQEYPYWRDREGNYTWGPMGPPPNLAQQRAATPPPAAVPAVPPSAPPPATTGAASAAPAASSVPSGYPPDWNEMLPSAQKAFELERVKKLATSGIKAPGQEQAAKGQAANALAALDKIDQLVENKGGLLPTTGILGGAISQVYQPSKDLAAALDTVKSVVGFDKLQEMRANSPTGGALGQVSDFENKLLQSTIASLEQSQSPAQLKANLARVRATFDWVVNRSDPNEPPPFSLRPGAAPTTESGGPAGGSVTGGRTAVPPVGTVSKGYRFKGGDPSQQSSWEAVR